ncbi:hypothetical protein [Pseudomonas frederiksbergensis]|uniref:hypothetical protein n=1 Tax=Pseudomonas frederiksbergensis TaxID=104087 RepID=UPI000944A726|nr:hypothetical protein [Pseudomonas frederiksbergensis]
MFALAVSLVDFVDLPSDFVAIAKAWQPKKKVPGPFWAVWFEGKIVAIYLDPNKAFAHMLDLQPMVNTGKIPRKQTINDVDTPALILKRRLAKVAREDSSDSTKTP